MRCFSAHPLCLHLSLHQLLKSPRGLGLGMRLMGVVCCEIFINVKELPVAATGTKQLTWVRRLLHVSILSQLFYIYIHTHIYTKPQGIQNPPSCFIKWFFDSKATALAVYPPLRKRYPKGNKTMWKRHSWHSYLLEQVIFCIWKQNSLKKILPCSCLLFPLSIHLCHFPPCPPTFCL